MATVAKMVVRVMGDTSSLDKSLSKSRVELQKLDKQLDENEKTLKEAMRLEKLLNAERAKTVEAIKKAGEAQRRYAAELEKVEAATKSFGAVVGDLTHAAAALNGDLAAGGKLLSKYGGEAGKAAGGLLQYADAAIKAAKGLDNFNKKFKDETGFNLLPPGPMEMATPTDRFVPGSPGALAQEAERKKKALAPFAGKFRTGQDERADAARRRAEAQQRQAAMAPFKGKFGESEMQSREAFKRGKMMFDYQLRKMGQLTPGRVANRVRGALSGTTGELLGAARPGILGTLSGLSALGGQFGGLAAGQATQQQPEAIPNRLNAILEGGSAEGFQALRANMRGGERVPENIKEIKDTNKGIFENTSRFVDALKDAVAETISLG